MSSPPPTFNADWTEIIQKLNEFRTMMDEIKGRLSPENGERFVQLFLAFTKWNPPSVPEAQETLRSIVDNDAVLLTRFKSFLTHPASTPEECKAARTEYGRLLLTPMLEMRPPIPGWTTEEFFVAIEERLGKDVLDQVVHVHNCGPRNSLRGIPTRPAVLKFLGDDAELLQRFEVLWPKERGDLW